MSHGNSWKMTAIGMALVITTALVTGLVVANWSAPDRPSGAPPAVSLASPPSPSAPAAGAGRASTGTPATGPASARPTPTAADVEACNTYARAQVGDKTVETVKDALIGAAAGAGVGAVGGAIAGGGKGAGKGAGIGGAVGAAAGTLYGLNEARSHDTRYVQAYRACMNGRGYTG
jgi:hypothetical protein